MTQSSCVRLLCDSATAKILLVQVSCALMARANHRMAGISARAQEQCAFLAIVTPVKSSAIAATRGKSAHLQLQDCFECRSPHKIAS